jgi:hypothetical protein
MESVSQSVSQLLSRVTILSFVYQHCDSNFLLTQAHHEVENLMVQKCNGSKAENTAASCILLLTILTLNHFHFETLRQRSNKELSAAAALASNLELMETESQSFSTNILHRTSSFSTLGMNINSS